MNFGINEPENTEGMEMPCPCQKCGDWFDLHDGRGSQKWFPNTVICESCASKEDDEVERDDRIQDIDTEIADLEYDLENIPGQIAELQKERDELVKQNFKS